MDKELKKHQMRTFYGYLHLLRRYHWHWFITLTFPAEFSVTSLKSYNKIDRMLLNWARNLQTSENLQIAFFMVLCIKLGHPHFHLLALGSNNDGSKTLLDISKSKWAQAWEHYAKIEQIGKQMGVIRYVSKHLLDFECSESEYDFYNRNLLKRFECRPQTYADNA
jgi:hypothetical protein